MVRTRCFHNLVGDLTIGTALLRKYRGGSHTPVLGRFSTAELVSVLPDFAVAGMFLITWLAPLTFGPKMIGYLLTVVLVELLVVIAAAFIGDALAH